MRPNIVSFCLTCLITTTCQSSSALYLEGDLGGNFSNWNNSMQSNFPSQTGANSINTRSIHGNQGIAGGGSIGYRHRFWSFEAGAFGLSSVNYNIQSSSAALSTTDTGQFSRWFIDGLFKLNLPISSQPNLEVFGKFGAAYCAGAISDQETISGAVVPIVNTNYSSIVPILGGGLQYRLNTNWMINAQYLFLPLKNKTTRYPQYCVYSMPMRSSDLLPMQPRYRRVSHA